MKDDIQLAIVIPYYKIKYFDELLNSLNNQTFKKFNVYIGNDKSPNSPVKIIDKYKNTLSIKYHTFEDNLGSKDLVAQWNRCLDLIKDENWVWILPDDDLPSYNVVEEFYKGLEVVEKHKITVFRMPLSIIDRKSNIRTTLNHETPELENNLDFYLNLLKGKRSSSLGDNIFSKHHLFNFGKFVNFPLAWGSDHATLLLASQGGKICNLSKSRFYFRMSGDNISSDNNIGLIKLKARIKFVKWLKQNESIFPSKPDKYFYNFFYLKGEYYVLSEWSYQLKLFFYLYKLRIICLCSKNIFPVLGIFFKKTKQYIYDKKSNL